MTKLSEPLSDQLKRATAFDEDRFLSVIEGWKAIWMNQTQNSKEDYVNYFRRAFGIDANMKHHLAKLLREELEGDLAPLLEALGRLADAAEAIALRDGSGGEYILCAGIHEALADVREIISNGQP